MKLPEATHLSLDLSCLLRQSLPSLTFEDEDELRLVQPVTPDDPYFAIPFSSLSNMTDESFDCDEERLSKSEVFSRMITPNKNESIATNELKRRTLDFGFMNDASEATRKRQRRAPQSPAVSVVSCDYSITSPMSHQDGWSAKLDELRRFKMNHGHTCVPSTSNGANASLARWVKRQRHQYKLKLEGKKSTMTEERITQLEECDFVWDSHQEAFQVRLKELAEFKANYGHTSVTTKYQANVRLATWCKCQRQQYRLFVEGKPSNLSHERIQELEKLEFDWKHQGRT
jgi:Helicase associated domain